MADRPSVDSHAIRIHLVLRSAQGLSVGEIQSDLHARHYVATLQDISEALARHPSQFRAEQQEGVTRWHATYPHLPASVPTSGRRPTPMDVSQPPTGSSWESTWELPWDLALETSAARPSPETVIARINEARSLRGDAVLDSQEAAQVAANLERRASDPNHYSNVCWNCTAVVDEGTNEHCSECRWLVCWCGACRKRTYVDRQGVSGACRREVWTLLDHDIPDVDFRGRRIVTARRPASDADSLRTLSRAAEVTALFHWSPARAIPTIARWGLLARPELKDRGVPFVPHGFGSQEKERALSAYVATSLRPKLEMMSTWSDTPVIWELDPEILATAGTLFVDANSASADRALDQVLSSTGAAAYQLALIALRTPGGQPEVLVPIRIPRAAIVRVHVPDEATAQLVRQSVETVGAGLMWDLCWSADCFVGAGNA